MIAGESHKMSLETSIWKKKGINNPRKGAGLLPSAVSPEPWCMSYSEPVLGAAGQGQLHSLKVPPHNSLLQMRIWPVTLHIHSLKHGLELWICKSLLDQKLY